MRDRKGRARKRGGLQYLDAAIAATVRDSFLGSMPDQIVREILRRTRVRDVPPGREFVTEEHPHRCGLVMSGLARAYTLRWNGSQVTQRRVGRGAAVGIRAMVGRRNRVRVQAITDVEFLEIDGEQLLELARGQPALALAIAEEIDRRLDDTERQAENIGGRVIHKLAAALLDLSSGKPLEVQISQEGLAETIGASRERVGHELRRLADARLVRANRRQILILDPEQLHVLVRDEGAARWR